MFRVYFHFSLVIKTVYCGNKYSSVEDAVRGNHNDAEGQNSKNRPRFPSDIVAVHTTRGKRERKRKERNKESESEERRERGKRRNQIHDDDDARDLRKKKKKKKKRKVN